MKATPELPLRILTHNIRYATSAPFKGERPWADRRQLLINELEHNTRHCPDSFVCLQEVLHQQLVDILNGLNDHGETPVAAEAPRWAYIGVGRDDGRQAGEYSPIFYQPAVWELRHWETTWLSETPDRPSKSWDAASIRIVTSGVFTHRTSRRTVLAMSTHLDDQGARSRFEAASIILAKIDEYRAHDTYGPLLAGVFLAGDFNSRDYQEAYKVLTTDLADAFHAVNPVRRYGNLNTFTGFSAEDESPKRIDYILLGRDDPWSVQGYAVLANRFDDGVFNSDHQAVIADVSLHNHQE
ncbi:hypothetical protein ASPZODRAFT_131926 [Penicilliopsis zonata CBS 506.65]|uniref:Endonuclease/exonuclease/phosphatase domain-containing protein n=1 Tax=Penicilliopsis zonata CBS 506.65 TaxID=1073090 RepID=A0A1L9SIG3_9EURO|nr:hypothetical protein ASPZODRAFT_131926 [Penicilliopsis zonata CBS 506.65]OJJ47005.1 hypothetical protein ASPZODRAFT_131926 [Penicilliopsis zonata CBS 506.65]